MKKKNKNEKKISRKKQKQLLMWIPLGIVLIIMFVFLVGYIIGLKTNKQSNLQDDSNLVKEESNDNEFVDNSNDDNIIELAREIYFLQDKDGKKFISNTIDNKMKYLGKYTCQNLGCGRFQYIPSPRNEHIFLDNNLVLISEWDGEKENTIVYNYQTNKIVATYDSAHCSYSFSDGSFSVLIESNDKMGVLGNNGNLVYDIKLDSWNYSDDGRICDKISEYDETHKSKGYNGINGVVAKNGKFGVLNFKTGEVVVDFKYAGIRLMYDGNYSVKEGNKWYLLNSKFEKIFKNGYDEVYSFDNVILVGNNVSENIVEYKLVDKQGKDLTNSVNVKSLEIDTYYEVKSGSIELGIFNSGMFIYDLSKNSLKFKSSY